MINPLFISLPGSDSPMIASNPDALYPSSDHAAFRNTRPDGYSPPSRRPPRTIRFSNLPLLSPFPLPSALPARNLPPRHSPPLPYPYPQPIPAAPLNHSPLPLHHNSNPPLALTHPRPKTRTRSQSRGTGLWRWRGEGGCTSQRQGSCLCS